MSSEPKIGLNNLNSILVEKKDDFCQVVSHGRKLLETSSEYQKDDWEWAKSLNDECMFIFSYLLYDYKKKILNLKKLKESVLLLDLLSKNFLFSKNIEGLSTLDKFQIIFTLYERLKLDEMSWEQCEKFVDEQIRIQLRNN